MVKIPNDQMFLLSGCLSLESLQKFQAGEYSGEIRDQINKHLKECRFCQEAMEGLSMIPDPYEQKHLIKTLREDMYRRIRDRETSVGKRFGLSRKLNIVAAAASILLLVGIFSVYNYLLKSERELIAEESVNEILLDSTDTSYNKDVTVLEDITEVFTPATHEPEEKVKIVSEPEDKINLNKADMIATEQRSVEEIPSETIARIEVQGVMATEQKEEIEVMAFEEEKAEALSKPVPVSPKVNRISEVFSTQAEKRQLPDAARSAKKEKAAGVSADMDIPSFVSEPEFVNNEYPDLADYIQKNLQYPDSALNVGLEGKVLIVFIINRHGKVKDVKVKESTHQVFEKEALRVVSASGQWQPATKNGEKVDYQMTVPVEFIIKKSMDNH